MAADNAAYLQELLARAAYVAEHLMEMIDRQTWRDEGAIGPEGQYEGDYRAAQVWQEIQSWKEAARNV